MQGSRSILATVLSATVLSATVLSATVLSATTVLAGPQSPEDAADHGAPAPAEDPSEETVVDEEIVVTARKREERLQSIPVAVTALTEETLVAQSVHDLSDVGDFAPNVDFSLSGGISGAPSEATVYIRGIGQINTTIAADPGVGIYVDGVYLARSQGAVFDLLDVERVEVLRGPQGTLFGKNTTGGAVQLVTKKPHGEFTADLDLTVGDLDRRDVRLAVNGALRDRFFGSLALASAKRDGFARSLASGERFNDEDRGSGRAALRWLPGDNLVVDLAVDATRERERAFDLPLVDLLSVPLLDFYNKVTAAAGFPTYDERFITGDLLSSFSTGDNANDGDVWGTSFKLGWNLGGVYLTSISAFRSVDFTVAVDSDASPLPFLERTQHIGQDQFSQELQWTGAARAGRLDWFAGTLFFTEHSRSQSVETVLGNLFEALEAAPGPIYAPPGLPDALCEPGPPPPGLPCFGGAGNPLNLGFATGSFLVNDLFTDSYAVFGEVSYDWSDKLTATAGLRYTYEEKQFEFFRIRGNGIVDDLFNADDWDAFSPRFVLAYQATPKTLVYGSLARGFKSGAFNARPQNRGILESVDPETVWTWEAGFKADLMGGRLRWNGAFFFNDYTDIQFIASLADDEGNPLFVLENAGKAEAVGGELELSARVGKSFSMTAAVGHVDAEYTELDNVQGATLDGKIPKTPEWTVTFSPRYSFALDGGELSLRADYSYRDKVFNDIANSPEVAQDPYGILHARAAFTSSSGHWDLAFFATNLTDERYFEHGVTVPSLGPAIVAVGRPREWGLSFGWHF